MWWSKGRGLPIFPIKVEGFSLVARVRDIRAMVPMEQIQGVEFCEVFLVSLVGLFLERKLYEVDYLSCI